MLHMQKSKIMRTSIEREIHDKGQTLTQGFLA
jgi:hypothetical protein